MNRLRGIRHDIFYPVSYLIQVFRHLRQGYIEKQGKKKQEANNHEKCLVVSDQLPV